MLYKSKVGLLTVAALIALIIPLAFGATEVYSDDAPPPTPDATPADSVAGDRAALAALYNATDGQGWRKRTNWLRTYAPLSYWYGVRTDSSGRVIELNLGSNRLSGEIPPELGNLTNLQHLNLSWNRLSGEIPPELGNLTNLQHLNLSGNNQLSGEIPPELGNLTNLQRLDFSSHNQLSGEIPPELGNLTNLRSLYFGHNQLSGEIPPELGNLTNLQRLSLRSTQLSGKIPPELGNLTNLQWLSLDHNQLSGKIPPELGNLTNLRSLSLRSTQLSGKIPPELGNLTNLRSLSLRSTQLSGKIPPELGNLTNLQLLHLDHNQLSGEIPPELGNLTNLQLLHLDHNQLSGEIPPELGNLTNLQGLHLHHNQLSGEIPPELDKLTGLWTLSLSSTQLSGKIPAGLGRLPYLWDLRLSDTNVECFPEGFSSRVIDQLVEQGLHACPAASIPPPTPRGLSVYWRDLSDYWTGGVFHINWLAMPGAASYQVLYRPDQAGSVWTGLETVQSTYAGFRPASAYQCETTYRFRIRAYGDGVAYSAAFGPFSKVVFETTEACPAPLLHGGFDASTAPDSHDGSASFSFEIHFSEEPDLGYANVRDHVLTVAYGDVTGAKRKTAGANIRWVITVQPDGNDAVTIALPSTTDCAASSAVCTEDGRMLSNRTSITVPGPADEPPLETTEQQQENGGQPEETANSPATGAPTITGTAQAGHTLTADPSGIADADGLVNAAFVYQWLADDANVAGATGSSYTPVPIDVGKAIKVRVSFTDDARYEETLTSAAVYIQPPPLHGGFDASTAPDSHDGSASFSFEIHFSEEPDLGYANVRDHVLTVAYGDVTGAKRKTAGANIRWVITVQPDGNDAVHRVAVHHRLRRKQRRLHRGRQDAVQPDVHHRARAGGRTAA